MSRIAVYDNVELEKRIVAAITEIGNCSQTCDKIKGDVDFRISHKLTQEDINPLYVGVCPPNILKISLPIIVKIAKKFNIKVVRKNRVGNIMKLDKDIETAQEWVNNTIVVTTPKAFSKTNPALRAHQINALNSVRKIIKKGSGIGKIILPTGTGKTRIEAESIVEMIFNNQIKDKWAGTYVVLSPRILLTFQLLHEISMILGRHGFDCNYLNVNSGDLDSSEIEKFLLRLGVEHPEAVESTTNKETIKFKISTAKSENKPLVIFSTYHSAEHVKVAAEELNTDITAYIYDEAQYCVSSGTFKEAPNYPSSFKFFFTATEKITDSDDGLGMQNKDKFGEVIFTEKPKTLIDRGEMASVALHLVGTRGKNIEENDYESMAKVVIDAFDKHRVVVRDHTFNANLIAPKMIVVCDKQDSMRGMLNSKTMKAYKEQNRFVNLYALSSDYGLYMNGHHVPRISNKGKEWMFRKLKDLTPLDEAIVFHVDMIAEGIDVPGITGIMPFRNLGKIKFLQNLGRGTRLISEDRTRLYSGEIAPTDWKNYVKPYCWLILPALSELSDDFVSRYREFVICLRSDFDFNTSENVVIDNIVGPDEADVVEDMVGQPDKKYFTGKGLVEDIVHAVEDAEQSMEFMDNVFGFNKSTEQEQIDLLRKVYSEEILPVFPA